jgi:hypothetical protein
MKCKEEEGMKHYGPFKDMQLSVARIEESHENLQINHEICKKNLHVFLDVNTQVMFVTFCAGYCKFYRH